MNSFYPGKNRHTPKFYENISNTGFLNHGIVRKDD